MAPATEPRRADTQISLQPCVVFRIHFLDVAALSVVFAMVEPERRSALAKAESRSPAPPPLSELSERRQVW